jgi:hypothetical protein
MRKGCWAPDGALEKSTSTNAISRIMGRLREEMVVSETCKHGDTMLLCCHATDSSMINRLQVN